MFAHFWTKLTYYLQNGKKCTEWTQHGKNIRKYLQLSVVLKSSFRSRFFNYVHTKLDCKKKLRTFTQIIITRSLQILNRTNNIFELVTVEPILTDRPPDRQRNEILLSDELESVDDRTLRLKGILFDIYI
jgi:hypothetical protein